MAILLINREQAGLLLAERLQAIPLQEPLVLALPRGGVPVAEKIAHALGAPLEVLVVRKVGAPWHEEFGIGAVTEEGHQWIDPQALAALGASSRLVEETLRRERAELHRRIERYRQGRPLPSVQGRSVIVVDDGIATGVTARVACAYLKKQGAAEVILAAPVCSPLTAATLRQEVDDLICLDEPDRFYSVGQFYENFRQVSDEEVLEILARSRQANRAASVQEVTITEGGVSLDGFLSLPPGAKGVVLFSHGSGSSRFSTRNQRVAAHLEQMSLGTLLFDLLTQEESEDRQNVFDIALLGSRLALAVRWLRRRGVDLPLGLFGASTGAGAALWAAAELGPEVSAVVSRGGRPDLAGDRLVDVRVPTLLIVGGRDQPVLHLNEMALARLSNAKLVTVPGATHLFEEAGAMERVEREAADWFLRHLKPGRRHEVA